MNDTLTKWFEQIETWERKTIKTVLAEAAENPALKKALEERYQTLIDFVEGKELQVLVTLPQKMTTQKVLKKEWEWEPGETEKELMAAMPVEEIKLTKMKTFPQWIVHFKRLRTLSIRESTLHEVPEGIQGIETLETLRLYKTRLKELPEWICDLPLKELEVTSNKLKSLPESIHNLSCLKTLDLCNNNISEIPDSLGQLTSLETLNLQRNNIIEIPDSVGNLTSLQELNLWGNQLTALPDSVGNLTSLQKLELSYNQLTALPDSLGQLCALETLDVRRNELSDLPASLSGLSRLEYLKISSNTFSELPEVISSFKSLRTLEFAYNEIELLPAWIGSLVKLEVLQFEHTKVGALPPEVQELQELYSFNIEHTPLQEGKLFSSSMKKQEIRDFFEQLFATEEDPAIELYTELESRDIERITKALDSLKASPQLMERAEKRYLPFIRARLNNAEAELTDFSKAMLSPEEENLLLKGKIVNIVGPNYISFCSLDGDESKLVVDFAGAMVKSLIDVEVYIQKAQKCSNEYALRSHAREVGGEIKRAILKESRVYSEGWFGRIYAAFARLKLSKIMFDHTHFDDANSSLYLREFYLFAGSLADYNFTMDIFQSDTPDLTEVFWMLECVPDTIWGDVEMALPKSPLPFEREAEVKIGDFNKWKTVTSEPAG